MADPLQRRSEESLIALAGILVTEQSLEKTLRQVLDLVCAAMPCADDGAVTLLEAEGPRTAAATSDVARRVDCFQYDAETGGPCLDAYRTQQIQRIDFTPEERRWPEYAEAAASAGILSTLSLPLVVSGDGLGALNIYCRKANGFGPADEALAQTFTSYAAVALANARVYWRTQRLAGELAQALSTRGVIEQAKGVIIAEQGCSADVAFEILVRASQHRHIKLHDVARELVERARSKGAKKSGT